MRTARLSATILFIITSFFLPSCTYQSSNEVKTASTAQPEPRYTYHEFDMVSVFYKTDDVQIYQKLLPHQFEIPAEPMVMAFVADYYKMDAATQPYKEAAMFLLVDYEGRPAWHCVTMPVTSNEARLGGIYFLGFPKIMGDITFKRSPNRFKGELKLKDQMVMSLELDSKDHTVTAEEKKMFDWLKGCGI